MSDKASLPKKFVSVCFKSLARSYVKLKKPQVIVVAGSVGKTSTKLMLRDMIKDSLSVSCMDDSYNNGLGLYLSIFEKKIPTQASSVLGWGKLICQSISKFFKPSPDILILEYGIDHPGDMDDMISFIIPDISILTAVTPEHMEYMKTLDNVAEEETKVLKAAKKFAIYNRNDILPKYIPATKASLYSYGSDSSTHANYEISSWQKRGAVVSFAIDGATFTDIQTRFVSEPLIRQLTGAALIAKLLGIPNDTIQKQLMLANPAASRMRVFDGINDSTIIDDTTNFSPDAGIEALIALKRLPGKRHIAVMGNMHELGDYAAKGYADVAKNFNNLDILVLVGDLSPQIFGPLARKMGFVDGNNLFTYETSVDAGIALREVIKTDDIVLVKGPFGGFFLEETVKKLLKDPNDSQYLTRQSDFWQIKKQRLFGDKFTR